MIRIKNKKAYYKKIKTLLTNVGLDYELTVSQLISAIDRSRIFEVAETIYDPIISDWTFHLRWSLKSSHLALYINVVTLYGTWMAVDHNTGDKLSCANIVDMHGSEGCSIVEKLISLEIERERLHAETTRHSCSQ